MSGRSTLKDYFDGFPERDRQQERRRLLKELRISNSYMSMLVNGQSTPGFDLALRIEQETGIPLRSLKQPSEDVA